MALIYYDNTQNYSNLTSKDVLHSTNLNFPIQVRMQNPEIPLEVLVVCKLSKGQPITNQHEAEDYNIFSGDKIGEMDDRNRAVIIGYMKELCGVLLQFMEAGYHLYDESEDEETYNAKRIEDWIINFEYPLLKMFKLYFDIKTSCIDVMFVDEFLDNPQFRQMITDVIMRNLSNFAVENSFGKSTENWRQIDAYRRLFKAL